MADKKMVFSALSLLVVEEERKRQIKQIKEKNPLDRQNNGLYSERLKEALPFHPFHLVHSLDKLNSQ